MNGTGSDKGNDDSNDVNSKLELQKLGDGIVDVPPPHHRLHYAREVIIGEDDIRSFFSDVGSSDPHSKPDISLLEGRCVVGTVAGHRDYLPRLGNVAVDDPLDQGVLVDGLGARQDP